MSNLIATSNVIRVKKNHFIGEGWEKDQVNMVGTEKITTPTTDHVKIECAPRNTGEPGINMGAALISLPKSIDPTLIRVRLRNTACSGLKLADINKLSVFTYILQSINNAAPIIALQVDIDNDDVNEFNIFFDPREQHALDNTFPIVMQNQWQHWDLLKGYWQLFKINRPELSDPYFTIETFLNIDVFKNARIINTTISPNAPNAGGGIRFTVPGPVTEDYNDFKGYIDAFIIGKKYDDKPDLYDFCL